MPAEKFTQATTEKKVWWETSYRMTWYFHGSRNVESFSASTAGLELTPHTPFPMARLYHNVHDDTRNPRQTTQPHIRSYISDVVTHINEICIKLLLLYQQKWFYANLIYMNRNVRNVTSDMCAKGSFRSACTFASTHLLNYKVTFKWNQVQGKNNIKRKKKKKKGSPWFTTVITKTRLFKYNENYTTKKGKFSIRKKADIFLIHAQNIDLSTRRF